MENKYYIDEDRLTKQEVFLGIIANELAEANRLKRQELKMKILDNELFTDKGKDRRIKWIDEEKYA